MISIILSLHFAATVDAPLEPFFLKSVSETTVFGSSQYFIMTQEEGFKQEGNWCCISTLILLVTTINLGIAAGLRILLDMEDEIHEPLIQGELRNNLTILLYVFCMTFFFGCWFCMCCACRPCRWAAACPSVTSKYITRISHKFISNHPRLRRRLSLDDSEIEIDEVVVNHHLTSPPLGNQRSDHYAYENPMHISESVIEGDVEVGLYSVKFRTDESTSMELQQVHTLISAEELEKSSRSGKKPLNRPAMQIYRPPGLRSGGSESGTASPGAPSRPKPAAGSKPLDSKGSTPACEENNNVKSSESGGSRASSRASPRSEEQRLARTTSSLSSDSLKSQPGSGGGSKQGNENSYGQDREKKPKLPSPPKKVEVKRKVMTEKEISDVAASIRGLCLTTNTAEVEQFIAGHFTSEELAECVGSALCQHAIEGGGGRNVSKLCGTLKDAIAVRGLVKGLLNSISQYFECRDRLRADHFRMWIAFLNFVSDFYSNLGSVGGDISSTVFDVFEYLLKPPILESVKIEELECLISSLLSIGWDLERDCPDKLALLKDLIRDAFIDVTEPWARKMILLLLELGASGWKLPPEANEYYFQQSSN